jgi:hypothetical protein
MLPVPNRIPANTFVGYTAGPLTVLVLLRSHLLAFSVLT